MSLQSVCPHNLPAIISINNSIWIVESTETPYISSFRLPDSPLAFLVDLHLVTAIMRLAIIGLLSLAVAGLVAGRSLFQDATNIVERQANTSSLNATLLQIFEDIEEAKTCNDCEACYNRRFLVFLC
jgi:hypothetical protein